MGIIKDIKKGILYILAIPGFAVGIALFFAIGFVIFLIEAIKKIIYFITGRNMGSDLSEDLEGKQILDEKINRLKNRATPAKAELVEDPEPLPEPSPRYSAPKNAPKLTRGPSNEEQIDFVFNPENTPSKRISSKSSPFAEVKKTPSLEIPSFEKQNDAFSDIDEDDIFSPKSMLNPKTPPVEETPKVVEATPVPENKPEPEPMRRNEPEYPTDTYYPKTSKF